MAKKKDKLDTEIAKAWSIHGNGVQVPIMDIPKIFNNAREAVTEGRDLNEHMQLIASQYKERVAL